VSDANRIIQDLRSSGARGRLRFLLRDSVVYGAFMAVSRFSALLAFPVLARAFSTSDYGIVDALNAFGATLSVLLVVGQDSALARYFYDIEDTAERTRMIADSLAVQAAFGLVACVVLSAGSGSFATRMLGSPDYAAAAALQFVSLPLVMLANFTQNLLKWTFSRDRFLVASIVGAAAAPAFSILVGVVLMPGVAGVMLGIVIGRVVTAAVGLWLCREWLSWPSGGRWVGRLLSFGAPSMMSSLLASLFTTIDRSSILQVLDPAALGLYAAGFKVAGLVALPITAVQMSWNPLSLAIYKERNAADTYNRVLTGSTALFALFAFIVTVYADPLLALLASERYRAGAIVVGPIAFGLVYRSVAWTAGIGIDLAKKPIFGTLTYVAGLAAAWPAMLVLGPRLGIAGIALGGLLGFVVAGVAYILASRRVHPLRLALTRPHAVLAALGGLALASTVVPVHSTPASILIRVAIVAIGVAATAALSLSRDDRLTAWRYCAGVLR